MHLDELIPELVHEFGERSRERTVDLRSYFDAACRKWRLINDAARRSLLLGLVRADLERRQRRKPARSGDRASWRLEDYVRELPELGPLAELPIEVIAEEFRLRLICDRRPPSVKEYASRFPRQPKKQLCQALTATYVAAVAAEEAPPTLKGFKIEEKSIGGGQFGRVFRAQQQEPNRTVAIKVLIAKSAEDREVLSRFAAEADLIAAIDHPHVIRVYHAHIQGATLPFLALEYAAGGRFRDRLDENRQQPSNAARAWQRRAAQWMRQIALGVAAAHDRRIIHRDLKPENVLLDEHDLPKVADFGLARQAHGDQRGAIYVSGRAGTIDYSSPEQRAGESRLTTATDVYSLGVMLFELLTIDQPFQGLPTRPRCDGSAEFVTSPRSIDERVHRDLDAICRKCLRQNPGERYANAGEMAEDLERFRRHWPVRARRARTWEYALATTRRWPMPTGLLVLALCGAIATLLAARETKQLATTVGAQRQTLRQKDEALGAKTKELAHGRATIAEQQKSIVRAELAQAEAVDQQRLEDYAADCEQIASAWERGDVRLVRELLSKHASARAGDEDLRGFEWRYWDEQLRRSANVLENRRPCRCLAVDPTGKWLAASGLRSISVWNLDTRRLAWTKPVVPPRRTQSLSSDESILADSSVAFSPDGTCVAATGFVNSPKKRVGNLFVWNVATGEERFSLVGELGISGRAVAFSPDGSHVLTGGYAGSWKSWDALTGAAAEESAFGPFREFARDLSPREQERMTLTVAPEMIVGKLVFTPDAKLVSACGLRGGVRTWQWPTGKHVAGEEYRYRLAHAETRMRHVEQLEFPPDGGGVGFGLVGGGLHVYQLQSESSESLGSMVVDAMLRDAPALDCFQVRDSQIVGGGADRAVYRWSFVDGDGHLIERLVGHEEQITCVTLSPARVPVSADAGGTIRIWKQDRDRPYTITSGSDCKQLMLENGRIAIRSETGEALCELPLDDGEIVGQALLSARERYVACQILGPGGALPGRAQRWIVGDIEQQRITLEVPSTAGLAALSVDESLFAATTLGGHVGVWEAGSGESVCELATERAQALAFAPSGDLLGVAAVGSRGGELIAIWDVHRKRKLCDVPLGDVRRNWHASGFTFSQDGAYVVTDETPPRVWRTSDGVSVDLPHAALRAMAEAAGGGRQRLYYMDERTLSLCCARTLRRLLTVEFEASSVDRALLGVIPIPGAKGYVACDALDRRLARLATDWRSLDQAISRDVTDE